MRVLQVVDTLAVGGRERLVVDLANEHAARGLDSHVCETRGEGELGSQLAPAVGRLVLARSRSVDVAAMAALGRYVRRHRIDVIHSHGRAVMQFVALVTTVLRLRAAHVFHEHRPGVDRSTSASRWLRLPARVAVDGVIAVSPDLRDWAVERLGVAPDRVWSILNGIDVERFAAAEPLDLAAELRLPSSHPVIVSVGNVRPQKDYETLLRSIARLDVPAALVIVGFEDSDAAYGARCRALVHELGLTDRVRFAGARLDVPEILAGGDIGVLVSRAESGPLAVAEFAAAALPIVATAAGPITAAVRGHAFAKVVPVGDLDATTAAINAMLALSTEERRALGRGAREVARQLFSLERMADQVIEVYAAVSGTA